MGPVAFDVCGPLPSGTTVLEASAGTGKTFTIAALATRYVAEGVAELSELLIVTFGRAATSELRDRVRERLVETERRLRVGDPRTCSDSLVRHLAAVDDAELTRRRFRLAHAVAAFDAASIATTHGFCQQMLASLGVLGDLDLDAVLVPDLADLTAEVIDDEYLRRYADDPAPALLVDDARQRAQAAVSDPHAVLDPRHPVDPDSVPAQRVAFADAVRRELNARKRARRILDYDDLLVLLREVLVDPEHGPAARDRLRARYRVVLVDEFQDTDPVQWDVLREAFHGSRTLVLIGDPKQAIYGFRGGDVTTYLRARSAAATVATLARNWRSDAALLTALDALIGGSALGPDILVRPVRAAHPERRLDGGAPLRLRHLRKPVFGADARKGPSVATVRSAVVKDVAADIVAQLDRVRIEGDRGRRCLVPGDIAVLTRRNQDAMAVRDALLAAGVPSVISGAASVFATPAARHWITLLAALERPNSRDRSAAVALTPFLGWDGHRLAGAHPGDLDALVDLVRRWAGLLATQGISAVLEAAMADGLGERLLKSVDGERMLTDLRHVGEAAHEAALRQHLGPAALTDWLRRRIAEAADDYAEERSRRLETDSAAVQVITVHASKGLEFPVVYVPFAWDQYDGAAPPVPRYHDDDGARCLHVGGPTGEGYGEACARSSREAAEEGLRLMYVALTRAKSQVVVTWALASRNSPSGPLTRVLLGTRDAAGAPPPRVPLTTDDAAAGVFAALAARSGGTIALERVDAVPAVSRWAPPALSAPDLLLARLDHRPHLGWTRSSYTRITAEPAGAGPPPGVHSEPETTAVEDEPDLPAADVTGGGSSAAALASPMARLPAGASFGTLVHAVLERVDPTAVDLETDISRRCAEVDGRQLDGEAQQQLADALVDVVMTPLGPESGDRRLRDFSPRDRLAELEFELPLAGGDRPRGPGADLGAIARLFAEHVPCTDVLGGYAERIAALPPRRLHGYLTGSLDAVLRVPVDGATRYVVVDYKTNRLAPAETPLTAWHYRPAALVSAMVAAHYPLQLLLYSVALHRYLRWRQPGYDPDLHLGGGLYLFLRGMCGADTPVIDGQRCGVFAWRAPTPLVCDLSALLDGRSE